MKKTALTLMLVAGLGLATSSCLSSRGSASTAPVTQSQNNPNGTALGNALGGLVGGLLTSDKVSTKQLVGTWSYVSPAVAFKSENFLAKAGGAAAAGTIEGKLAPYYTRMGLNKMVLTVKEDSTFTMTAGKIKMQGTITANGNDELYFNFAAGVIPLGSMKTYTSITAGRTLSLMFDVKKLVSIVKLAGTITGSGIVNSVSDVLDSYDGITAGFKLKKK